MIRLTTHFGGAVQEMASVEDRTAPGAAGALPIRIYRPVGLAEGPAAGIIFFHGGGWTVGCIASYDKVCRNIAAACACAVVSVEYRLGPEDPLPAASHDAIAVTLWMAAHAAELGLDGARLAVAGDSAGGALAAVAAIAARDAGVQLRCQVLFYPATDLRTSGDLYPSRAANADVFMLDWKTAEWFGRHSRPAGTDVHDWRVSVMLATDLRGVAPVLMFTAERDILHDEEVAFAERLETAGVEVMRRNFPGMVHGFIQLGGVLEAAGEAIETMGLFVRQRLLA